DRLARPERLLEAVHGALGARIEENLVDRDRPDPDRAGQQPQHDCFHDPVGCMNRAISDTSAETNGRAAGATSAGFMSGILSTQVPLFPPGANGCRFHSRASGAAICASAKA